MPALPEFGRRIMICGPSGSGKSTLAVAISRKLGAPAVHLDQLRHLPDTDWVQRPDSDFRRLHDEAILGDAWVMEGNYSILMPQRRERDRHHSARWQSLGEFRPLSAPHAARAASHR